MNLFNSLLSSLQALGGFFSDIGPLNIGGSTK